MRLEKKTILLVTLVFIAAITAFAALQQQGPSKSQSSKTEEDPRPIVDYADPKSTKNDYKRLSKGRRYDGGAVQKSGTPDGLITHFDDWEFRVSAIPAAMSDAVVVGTVVSSTAYLSPDATGVYTEFTIQVHEVLKDLSGNIAINTSLAVDRAGGRVRYPSGAIVRYVVSGQSVPKVNKRYVLFLKLEDQGLKILTGYELDSGGVTPLDRVDKFKKHKGMDESDFLDKVRNSINSGSDTSGMER